MISILLLLIIVFLTNFLAIDATKPGIFVCCLTISIESLLRFEKGESKTIPAMELSLDTYNIEVTAPIDLPQRPIKLTVFVDLKYSMIYFKSSYSFQPRVTYSPPERPHPLKSKLKTVMFKGNKTLTQGKDSNLFEQFPCK